MQVAAFDGQTAIGEWEQKASTFEVIACAEQWQQLPPRLHQAMQQQLGQTLNARQPLLFLSFDGLMERRYNAFLLTAPERVLLYYERDGDLINDYIGQLNVQGLWEFLDSFPNVYRHLSTPP